ncbi:hypothetical protein BDA96_02G346800 [Sorghum bicolor]|uniref:Uncharacterized protein n=1 Tax=Sorghum bicolor TaxID=4558 RepID=A0A921RU75_SORBI|nr:hypothetical protein BDA96_02G346800 [Sorghum bicolor]
MKLFAFVRRARRSPDAAPEDTATATAVSAAAGKRRRRPSSSSSSSSGSAAAWKPTLGAISEDAAMTAASMAKAQAKPASAPKARARSPRRATRAASYDDDFRHYGQPTVLPAFTPTAFLF